jgi:predicted phosphodiesterase
MNLVVLADIHANYPALCAVAQHIESWKPDQVVVAGDVVNRGPKPLECWQFVEEKEKTCGWRLVRGNHEDYVLTHKNPDRSRDPVDQAIAQSSWWTFQKLGDAVSALETLPDTLSIDSPRGEIRITHASMKGNRVGIYPWMSDDEIKNLVGDPPSLFCVGHTHIPLVRRLNGTMVVNVGSAGLPFDGDTCVSYAQITSNHREWNVEIVRLNYDRAQAERDHFETGYNEDGGALAKLVIEELRRAKSAIFQWTEKYEKAVRAGEIGIDESVRKFLEDVYK